MEVRHCRATDSVALPVIEGLRTEYASRYPGSTEIDRVPATAFDPPEGCFVIVVSDGETIAGGGIRRLGPGACEVKRMWTHPAHRRKGLGSIVLDELEVCARAAGYEYLRLETGPLQPEAEALYERRYRRIPTYGPYPSDAAYELHLTDPRRGSSESLL